MSNRNQSTSLMVTTALMTALTILCTLVLRVSVDADCYIHLGDAVLFLSVMILPRKYACFAAPVGAAVADLLGGFAFWAPWTLAIKLLMVLVYGLFVDIARKKSSETDGTKSRTLLHIPYSELLGIILACLVGVFGYFFAERILYGNWISAATCIPFNCIQTILGSAIALIVYKRLA